MQGTQLSRSQLQLPSFSVDWPVFLRTLVSSQMPAVQGLGNPYASITMDPPMSITIIMDPLMLVI